MIETNITCHCDKCGQVAAGEHFYRVVKEKVAMRQLSHATIPMTYSDGIRFTDPWQESIHVCETCIQEIFRCHPR